MWWWLYVVVEAVHGGDGHHVWQCMVVLLYDCICARWLWSIMNEHATATINMKGCTLMIDVEEHEQKRKKKKRKKKR